MNARWLLGVVACGQPVDGPDPPTDNARFPHPTDYLEQHGAPALAQDADCADCHAQDEGVSASGPACGSCHDYPHAATFSAGRLHGRAWAERGDRDPKAPDIGVCSDCHGQDGTRAPAGVANAACHACHSTYPHSADWSEGPRHGAVTLARGTTAACATCHGGEEALPTKAHCGNCHLYPHPPGFSEPAQHGQAVQTSGSACGTTCHTKREPTAPPSCARCHDLYPHEAAWTQAHIPPVQQRSEVACVGCHPAGLSGPALPTTCSPRCHGGGP